MKSMKASNDKEMALLMNMQQTMQNLVENM